MMPDGSSADSSPRPRTMMFCIPSIAQAVGRRWPMVWNASPVTSNGIHAPPIPDRMNIGIIEKMMVWSSVLARTPISSPRLAVHSDIVTANSSMATGARA